MTDPGADWYCVYTSANSEGLAYHCLKRKGFQVYLPQYVKMVRRGGRVTKLVPVSRPLFTRYLFVSFDLDRDLWQEIPLLMGIERLLSHGETPMRVPAGAVESIRLAEICGDFSPRSSLAALQLQIGELVRVKEGPFKDWIGEVTRSPNGSDRVEILLKLFGRDNFVKIGVDSVEKECT